MTIGKVKEMIKLFEKAYECARCPFKEIKNCSLDKECDLTVKEAVKAWEIKHGME